MNKIKAILIDPFARVVEPVELDDNTNDTMAFLRDVYRLIGTDEVTGSRLIFNGDFAWYDDNGALRDWSKQAFFSVPFYPGSLTGRWLIVRTEQRYEDDDIVDVMVDCHTDLNWLRAAVRWIEPQQAAMPAATIQTLDKDGRPEGKAAPLYGGSKIWTINDNPGKDRS